jgi:hypothetical protein
VLHDEIPIGAADGKGATGAALPDDHADYGNIQAKHLAQVYCDGLTLQPMF